MFSNSTALVFQIDIKEIDILFMPPFLVIDRYNDAVFL